MRDDKAKKIPANSPKRGFTNGQAVAQYTLGKSRDAEPEMGWATKQDKEEQGKLTEKWGVFIMQRIHSNSPRTVSKTKTTYRDRIDLLRGRIGLLTGKNKLLMTMYLENGNSFRQLARLAGVCEANIARRINRITRRLLDGEYITCVRNRDRFTRTEMAIAKDCFLLGLSQRKIAPKRRCSVHQVCKILKRVQEIIRTADNA